MDKVKDLKRETQKILFVWTREYFSEVSNLLFNQVETLCFNNWDLRKCLVHF